MANIARIAFRSLLKTNGGSTVILSRTITSRTIREKEGRCRPKPWDYENKPFNLMHYYFDKTTSRFDENSKIVVVEGPIAAGKTEFAKCLAQELDMLYLPEANLDMIYINRYGYDLRCLDEQLPPSTRSYDVKDFLVTPKHENTAYFQILQYTVKYMQYIDALCHLFSTGQGVVLDRCCYSDFVFAEAMCKSGYISKPALKAYYDFRNNTLQELLRPHLVIYLDVPAKKVQENIKKRNIPLEVKSSALSPKYLETMEMYYKRHYLKEISSHAELLVYDWSEPGDSEIVVEDIERIDFGKYNAQPEQTKMKDWDLSLEEEYAWYRHRFSDKKEHIMGYFNIPTFDVPELVIEAEDYKEYTDILETAPGERFAPGFNADMGDSNILFKMNGPRRDTLPRIERKWT